MTAAPCNWPVNRSCLPPLPATNADNYAVALAQRNGAEDLAVAVMFALSGRQFGVCSTTVRPCRLEHSVGNGMGSRWDRGLYGLDGFGGDVGSYGMLTSYVLSWEGDMGWVNLGCGCVGRCRVAGPRMIHLPGPAQAVTEVKIGEVVQDPSTYTLEQNRLYRIGGIWPGQDLARPDTEAGTWSVTYDRGIPVPAGVDMLTGQLALEMLNACTNANKCRLPRNVVAVSRNGVSYQVYDPTTFYAAGKTGLPEIDLWLMSVNPNHIMAAPSVI